MLPNPFEIAELIESAKKALPRMNTSSLRHTVQELWELVELADTEFGGVKGLVQAVKEARLQKR